MKVVDIFIAYSHRDLSFKNELRKILRPLLHAGKASVWDDYDIEAGKDWEAEIKKRLHSAEIILLLVSPDSLDSDYFYGKEVTISLERHTKGEATVVPIILRHCLWHITPLGSLEALPEKGKAVASWISQDEAMTNVALRLLEIVEAKIVEHAEKQQKKNLPKTTQAFVKPVKIEQPKLKIPDHFVFVKGGTFQMGDLFGDVKDNDATPHTVTLHDFYISKYAVTFDEYDAFCAATNRYKSYDHGWGRGRRPVIVAWYDAAEYCNWFSQQEGLKPTYSIDKNKKDPDNKNPYGPRKWLVTFDKNANGYRLPTEAEWEYAARAVESPLEGGNRGEIEIRGGGKVRFGNGKDIADPVEINFNASKSYKRRYSIAGEYRRKTLPVDALPANALGLHHMSGNVREWCWDWYEADFYKKNDGATDPMGQTSGKYRVVRGGSWDNVPVQCRAACRFCWDSELPSCGFRLARY